jgi:hypothetical protein
MSGRKPASGPADADQGNPYLEARARNIALNQAELRKLGLSPAVDAKVQRTRGGAATKGSKRKRGAQEEGVAVRRSSRFRGKKPEFGSLPADFRELPADDQARHNKRPKRVVKPKVKKEKPPQPGDASKVGNLNAIEPKAWVGRYIPVPDGQNKAAVVHLLRNGDLSGKKRVRFNRMGGLLEWKNCLCVWVNAQSVCYDNLFSNDFTTMTWYACPLRVCVVCVHVYLSNCNKNVHHM